MRFRQESWNDFLARCEQGAVEHGVRPRLQLYSTRSARRLLAGFDEVRTRTVHAAGFRLSDRVAVGRLAGRFWGWYVLVEGVR
jgi:hypothetical protein